MLIVWEGENEVIRDGNRSHENLANENSLAIRLVSGRLGGA